VPAGRIEGANQAQLEMLGYAEKEFLDRPIADFEAGQKFLPDHLGAAFSGDQG